MASKAEKVKEPSSGEAIVSAADQEDLDDEKMSGFQGRCPQEYPLLPGE